MPKIPKKITGEIDGNRMEYPSEEEFAKRYREIGEVLHEIRDYHKSMRERYLPRFVWGVRLILIICTVSAVTNIFEAFLLIFTWPR